LPRDEAYVLDILKAARLAIEFKGTADRAAFLADAKSRRFGVHRGPPSTHVSLVFSYGYARK